jgi:phosphate:Na+ symporter
LALERVQMEIGHLGEITQDMLEKIRPAFLTGKPEELDNVAKLDDKADILHDEIMGYLNKLQKEELTEEQNDSLLRFLRISEDLERVGDVIETDLVETGHEAMREDIASTETTRYAMKALYEAVKVSLAEAIQAIVKNDELASQQVIHMKNEINNLVKEALEYQAARVKLQEPDAMKIMRFEGEVIDALKRIYSLAKRIAKLNIPEPLLQEAA